MTEQSFYIHDIPLAEARTRLDQALQQAGIAGPLAEECLPLDQAVGRISARPVWAKLSSPHYHASAMDGFALRAQDSEGAADRNPVTLVTNQFQYVDTGDPLPNWANAVVPIELVEKMDSSASMREAKQIRIRAALAPWKHIRPMGEDMVATELVIPAGRCLRPVDLGAIAGCGFGSVWVQRKPRVAIIPTGSELVPVGSEVKAGDIFEYNSLVMAAQVQTWGGTATRWQIVPDEPAAIQQAVRRAASEHDLVLVNAGSSAGSEDFTAEVVASLGELLVHGIAVRPGHPVILGMINSPTADESKRQVPVIGVPGYPVSAALTAEIFVEPLLALWTHRQPRQAPQIQATLTRKVHSSPGDDEFLRVTVGKVGDRVVASPLSRGAGVISSLVRADGIVCIPAGVQGVAAGEKVQVALYHPAAEIDRTLVVLGSHDLTIDLLAQFLAEKNVPLSSANLGSLGGLIALKRSEAHFAGSHLLDPESGEYNFSYIRRYLPGIAVVVMNLVTRKQGLMVNAGNPENIVDLNDLAREDISFVNRQRGAGTRVLLDHHLEELGLATEQVNGYTNEEYTHLTVAAAIASGRADCGLGIRAAADALQLDFIPLYDELYDLVIPEIHFDSDVFQPVLEVVRDPTFKQAVASLPGYGTQQMGQIRARITPDES